MGALLVLGECCAKLLGEPLVRLQERQQLAGEIRHAAERIEHLPPQNVPARFGFHQLV